MKDLIFSAGLLSSVVASAGVQFHSNSQLPGNMQQVVLTALHHQCPVEMGQDLIIVEESTSVQSQKIDQGQVDYFYSTKFKVVGAENDSGILVETVDQAIQNGDPEDVRLVYGCGNLLNFQCVQNGLKNLGSDLYSNLKSTEIHDILMNVLDPRHETVVQTAAQCK